MNRAAISSIINMKSAHDENISFCPASAGSARQGQRVNARTVAAIAYHQDQCLHRQLDLEKVVSPLSSILRKFVRSN